MFDATSIQRLFRRVSMAETDAVRVKSDKEVENRPQTPQSQIGQKHDVKKAATSGRRPGQSARDASRFQATVILFDLSLRIA